MESIKHGNSETSGEENGHPSSSEKSNEDHKSGTGRSYECTFCKRGFTNAQALGGHMNIHRKDKVKAKAEKSLTKSKKKDYMVNNNPPSSYFMKISSDDQQGNYYHNSSSFGGQMNYQSFYPPSNPSYSQGYNCHYASGYYDGQRADQFGGVYDEAHLGANLSIGIGAADMESSSGRGKGRDGNEDWLENEIDLELRLGQYP